MSASDDASDKAEYQAPTEEAPEVHLRALRIEPFEDEAGYPRLRILAANGRILVSSEAYEGGHTHRDEAMGLLATGEFVIVGEDDAEEGTDG